MSRFCILVLSFIVMSDAWASGSFEAQGELLRRDGKCYLRVYKGSTSEKDVLLAGGITSKCRIFHGKSFKMRGIKRTLKDEDLYEVQSYKPVLPNQMAPAEGQFLTENPERTST